MDFVSFLSMIIYEVLDTLLCCSKHNIVVFRYDNYRSNATSHTQVPNSRVEHCYMQVNCNNL